MFGFKRFLQWQAMPRLRLDELSITSDGEAFQRLEKVSGSLAGSVKTYGSINLHMEQDGSTLMFLGDEGMNSALSTWTGRPVMGRNSSYPRMTPQD